MIVYDFDERDYQRIIWELSNKVKDLEQKVEYLEAIIDTEEDTDGGLDGMAE